MMKGLFRSSGFWACVEWDEDSPPSSKRQSQLGRRVSVASCTRQLIHHETTHIEFHAKIWYSRRICVTHVYEKFAFWSVIISRSPHLFCIVYCAWIYYHYILFRYCVFLLPSDNVVYDYFVLVARMYFILYFPLTCIYIPMIFLVNIIFEWYHQTELLYHYW